MRTVPAALCLLMVASCTNPDPPAAEGDQEKFARVFARLVMASAITQGPTEENPQRVLADENMSPDEFRALVAEYNRDPARWEALIKEVRRIVEERTAPQPSSAIPGDTTSRGGTSTTPGGVRATGSAPTKSSP